MVAEYQPQTGKYYYYTTDQIGSTRIVTDDAGNIFYAAAHDPYGGVKQTWVNTFNPELKFSGKEQDTESGLYYFGARYYDPTLYRFLSPDPGINAQLGMANPQFWNLYSYCGNNPVNFFDKEGRSFVIFIARAGLLFIFDENGNLRGVYPASNTTSKKYPEGRWRYTHYNPHEGAQRGDPIDDTGFFGFDAPSDEPGSMGIHAGRYVWWWPTAGCIRTTREAMELMRNLHESGDKMRFLIAIWEDMFDSNGFFDLSGILSKVEFYLRGAGYGNRYIEKVTRQIETYLWQLFGPLDFMYDYWFNSESPIPPNAF